MVDIHSTRSPLTINLPNELIKELHMLAREKKLSIDDVIMEACLLLSEPHGWERDYRDWCRTHPKMALEESGIDGDKTGPLQYDT